MRILASLAFLALLLPVSAAVSQGQESRDVTPVCEEVESRIICPCPDCSVKLLSTCFCGNAQKTKEQVKKMAAEEGLTADQIVAAFVEEYGEEIRAQPEEKGFNLVGYWFPTAALLAGGVAVAIFLRRAVQRGRRDGSAGETVPHGETPEDSPGEAVDEYEERLQRELKSLS